ncbi:MAG: sugar phosphate isomerase/epimerase [Oscillospiraceae bacterium]|jgi:sugar phosphate isomerase/epimerase|nr:sugar phosphate isomerase/epimerase [Oscillospiraceae bacterium]
MELNIPMALGLFSVRDAYARDFEGCIRQVAEMGYTGVECFGAPTLPPERVAEILHAAEMALVGWHLPIEMLEGEAFESALRYVQAVNCPRIVVPSADPSVFATRQGILDFAARLDAIAERFAHYGIALGYHNHAAEFRLLPDGTLPWAVLMDHTTEIFGQLDNGNAMASAPGVLDPALLLSQWPGRAQTIHVKPYSYKNGFKTMIGEDDVDWPELLQAAETMGGTQWLVVEYEEDDFYGQMEGAKLCFEALSRHA